MSVNPTLVCQYVPVDGANWEDSQEIRGLGRVRRPSHWLLANKSDSHWIHGLRESFRTVRFELRCEAKSVLISLFNSFRFRLKFNIVIEFAMNLSVWRRQHVIEDRRKTTPFPLQISQNRYFDN
ncbi:MAG: hypothetical protein ACI9G1_000617 [Pirellulaceae bacterium]|jgi:hypothetical protein